MFKKKKNTAIAREQTRFKQLTIDETVVQCIASYCLPTNILGKEPDAKK
jgi:hypothetical protein